MARAFRRQFGRRNSADFWPTDAEGPLDVILTRDNTEQLLQRWQNFSEKQATDASVEASLKAIQDEHDAMVSRRGSWTSAAVSWPAGHHLVC